MNRESHELDQGTARVVEAWLRQGVQSLPEREGLPDGMLSRVVDEVEHLPQQRRWQERFRLGRQRRDGFVLGAAAAAAVSVLMLISALSIVLPDGLVVEFVPVETATHHVAQDGSGDFTTIGEAVAAAHDGDTVLIAPGTYTEAVVIERDIIVRGGGPREDVVIVAPEGGPRSRVSLDAPIVETDAYAVLMLDTSATLEDLTLRGGHSVVHASGGSPTLQGLVLDRVGLPYVTTGHNPGMLTNAIVINGDSTATVVGNRIDGGGYITIGDAAAPVVSGNELVGSKGIFGGGSGSVIEGNTLRGSRIWLHADPGTSADAVIRRNDIADVASDAILITYESTAVVEANDIRSSTVGISVQSKWPVSITGNTLAQNGSAIIVKGSSPVVSDNEIHENGSGVFIAGGAPSIRDNRITGGTVGLGLGGTNSEPILADNTICDNVTNVDATFGAEMPDLAGNTVCTTYHVAQDGSGDFSTIGEAVAAAQDGDTVLIWPGTYVEAVVIERDITLRGSGPREDVVIVAPEDGPGSPLTIDGPYLDPAPYALLLVGNRSTIENLTFTGDHSAVHATGGSPRLTALTFDGVLAAVDNFAFRNPGAWKSSIVINGGSSATVEEVRIVGGGAIEIWDGSDALVIDNEIGGTKEAIRGQLGEGAIIRDNRIVDVNIGIELRGATRALIERNAFEDARATAIQVGFGPQSGVDPVIRGNSIVDSEVGITVGAMAEPVIDDNDISRTGSAIVIAGSDASVVGNKLEGNGNGIFVMHGSPVINANVVTGGTAGLALGGERATPSLEGNEICGNATNVRLSPGAQLPDLAGNDVCADGQDVASQ